MSTEPHLSNPAGRLWTFLQATRSSPASANLRNVWAAYFAVSPQDVASYVKAMTGVLQQVEEMEAAVELLDDPNPPATVLLRPVATLRQNLGDVFMGGNQVNWATQVFDSGLMNDLETCSYVLSRSPVPELTAASEDQLEEIRQLVNDLIAATEAEGSLDPEVRASILRYAFELARALSQHKVLGPQALIDQLDRFMSEFPRVVSRAEPEKRPSKPVTTVLAKIAGTIVIAVELFTVPADLAQAIDLYSDWMTQAALATAAPAPSPMSLAPTVSPTP